MAEWEAIDVAPDLQVRAVREMPALAEPIEREVDAIWRAACAAIPTLFNGRVFCAETIDRQLISGHWTEYRRILAQFRKPALHEVLQVRGLAVCGILRCPGGTVFGRRQSRAVYQPGSWSLPPAGNVDDGAVREGAIDLRGQLLRELEEELGLLPSQVTIERPLAAVIHPNRQVVDVGFALSTALSEEEIVATHHARADEELDQLRVIADAQLDIETAAMPGELMALAAILIARRRAAGL
jgi:8-oxo-dGTP pyrophosphatase MutT (NUDIX family)